MLPTRLMTMQTMATAQDNPILYPRVATPDEEGLPLDSFMGDSFSKSSHTDSERSRSLTKESLHEGLLTPLQKETGGEVSLHFGLNANHHSVSELSKSVSSIRKGSGDSFSVMISARPRSKRHSKVDSRGSRKIRVTPQAHQSSGGFKAVRSTAGWRIPIDHLSQFGRSKTMQEPDSPSRKRQVYVCVVFLKVGEIDTIKEQYAADVLIKSKWREPSLDHQIGKLEYDWANSFTPKLYIENTIGEAKEHVYQMITFNECGHAFLCEKRRVSGIFLENLELDHFPFDVQDLTITVVSNLATTEIRLVNDPDECHRVNKQSFIDEQEWYLYKHIETEQKEMIYEYSDPVSVRPALSVKCRAARRPAYFIWNIFLVTFLICSLSMITFAVDKKLPQNRLQLTFTLVLTLVAFKFVVNQCLPKISYLTYLDKYVISSLFILTLICVWHGVIVVVEGASTYFEFSLPRNMEVYVIVTVIGAYIIFNVSFVILIYVVACKRRRVMTQRDKEYTEKLQCQMKNKGTRAMRMVQQIHQIHEVKENGTTTFI